MKFWKYSALGNTFAVVPRAQATRSAELTWVRKLCDRRLGVAADGAVIVQAAKRRVHMYNADGRRAELSGNGVRCAAAWLLGPGGVRRKDTTLTTDAGPVACQRMRKGQISVELPPPCFDAAAVPARSRTRELWGHSLTVPNYAKRVITVYAVYVGNPQCVVWCTTFPAHWEQLGEALHSHRIFPEQTNVVFARRHSTGVEARLWERGVGVTLASGTGAAAAALVGARLERTQRRVRVTMPGGVMRVWWKPTGQIELTSDTKLIAAGEWHGAR